MKKYFKRVSGMALAAGMSVAVLAGCGAASDNTETTASTEITSETDAVQTTAMTAADKDVDLSKLVLMSDALKVDSEVVQSEWNDTTYVYVFDYEGAPVRVRTDITSEIKEKLDEINFNAEEDKQKSELINLIGDLKITEAENLSEFMLTQEEMDGLVGKTGQELIDDGFETNGNYLAAPDGAVYVMIKDLGQYTVKFNEVIDSDSDIDPEEAVKAFTVKTIEYECPSEYSTIIQE